VTAYLILIELRRRRWALLALGAVVAVVVGTVLASLAGARRAETAFDRYLEELRAPDAMVVSEDPAERQGIGDLESVESAVEVELVAAFPLADPEGFYPLLVSETGEIPFERMRAPVVDGRFPERHEPFEVAVSERTARRLRVDVGDELPLATLSPEAAEADEFEPDGPPVTLNVVGIVRDPGDVGSRESDITLTFLSPAFRDVHGHDVIGSIGDGTLVTVADGHSLSDLTEELSGRDVEVDASFSAASTQQQIAPTMQAIATSTRLFALVAALAGLIAVGQAVARLQLTAGAEDPTLEALGTERRARWHRLFTPIAIAVGGGTILGGAVAVGLSTFFPVGLARRADPDLGFDVDGGLLSAGLAVSLLVLTGLTALLASWRVRRSVALDAPIPLSRLSSLLADAGAPAAATTGLAMAAGTPGRPGRIAIVGTMLSVLGVLATLVFSASVDRLVSAPELYGWGWDATIEGADLTDLGEDGSEAVGPRLAADADVEVASRLYSQLPVTVDDVPLFGMTVAEAHRAFRPVVVSGAAPVAADEVALGGSSMETVGVDVGDEVVLSLGSVDRPARITGMVALPVPEDGGSSGTGVYLSPAAVDAFDIDRACIESDSCTRTIAVELRRGADAAAFADRYSDEVIDVALPDPPGEVDRLTAVEHLPRYLAVFLALLAAAAISFATTTTVRQRRRDLAVLRVLGMTGRHVRTVVVVLVLALTLAGALLGGILGLVVGRLAWRAVADSVALPFSPSIPVLAAVLVPIGAVLLAQIVASTSRRAASRIPAAMVLRAE
jgi:ABC-type lipoprotein release transport system permease subunit